jgi:hypothetical protein
MYLLLAQLGVFVFGLVTFQYGTWFQVEPIMLAIYVLAAATAAWLAAGLAKGWLSVMRPVHPVLLVLFAWVGWQWLATAAASSPWRSWFGHPSNGEGAAYYTAMLLCCLLACALWQNARYLRLTLAVAAINLALMAWLHMDFSKLFLPQSAKIFTNNVRAAANWPDYLVFIVAYFWIACAYARKVLNAAWFAGLLVGSVFIVFLIADNRFALIVLAPMFFLSALLLLLQLWRTLPAWCYGRGARGLCMVACLLPLAWLVASQSPDWAAHEDGSLRGRALFGQVGMQVMANEPLRWLVGDGWGRFADDVFSYAMLDGIHVYQDGRLNENWLVTNGISYHAHNMAMELLLSLGLVGLLLWLALPVAILYTLPRVRFWGVAPVLVGVFALQAFWFAIPQVLPYQALCWAGIICAWYPNQKMTPYVLPRSAVLAVVLVAAVMSWSAHAHWQAMQYGQRLFIAIRQEPAEQADMGWVLEDMKRGGDRLRAAGWFYGGWVQGRMGNEVVTQRDMAWYALLLKASHQAAQDPNAGPWLVSLDAWLHNLVFMVMHDAFSPLRPEAKKTLPEAVLYTAKAAPLREDMSTPLLYSLGDFTQGNKQQAMVFIEKLLAVAPEHRGALWVMGRYLMGVPERKEEGKAMLAKAIKLGADRIFPISLKDKQLVESLGN